MTREDIQYVREHPPRCIASLNPKVVEHAIPTLRLPWLDSIYHENYDWENTVSFMLRCPCGFPSIYLLGYCVNVDNASTETGFVGPLSIECSKCSTIAEIFDTRKHGYDGEQGVNTCIWVNLHVFKPCYRRRGARHYACPICGVTPLIVSANFHYTDFEDLGPEMRKRAQDFFDGFDVVGQCTRCHSVIEITSFECA